MYLDLITRELQEASAVLECFQQDATKEKIQAAAFMVTESFQQCGKVIACGNGGSHCDAMHFAEELTGRFRENRKPLPAIAISDPSHLSCVANDFGFEHVFSRFVEGLGQPGDVLLAISTSGQSKNICNAALCAKKCGMKVLALTGKDGGQLASLADVEIRVPHFGFADRIQEIHIKTIHILIQIIEKEMNTTCSEARA